MIERRCAIKGIGFFLVALSLFSMFRTASPAEAQPITNFSTILQFSFCTDPYGTPVQTVAQNGGGQLAFASIANGVPIISMDPSLANQFPLIFDEFAYFHECGHHQLGHVVQASNGIPVTAAEELQADCFSLQVLVSKLGVHQADLNHIYALVTQFGIKSATHPPGPARAQLMAQQCGVVAPPP